MGSYDEKQLLAALGSALMADGLRGVVAFSPDGKPLWANKSAADIAGTTLEEVMRHDLQDGFWGEGLAEDAEKALKGGELVRREVGRNGSDGHRQWIERAVVSVELLGQKNLVMLVEDRTVQKQEQEWLRLANHCLDKAGEMIYWVDEEARFCYVNEATCAKLGYSKEELLGMRLHDIDPWAPSPWKEHWQEFRRRGHSVALEARHRTKTGEIVEVEVEATHIEFLGKEYHCIFARDIGAQKTRERLAKLAQISVDRAAEQVFWLDSRGRLVFVNDSACRAFGGTREELIGQQVSHFFPELQGRWNELWDTVKREGRVEEEALLEGLDQERKPVEISLNYLEYDGREYLLALARDISQRRQMEESLWLMQASLDQAQEQIFWMTPEGRFVYVSDSTCEQLGYSKEELLQMSISDLDPQLRGVSPDRWEELKRQGSLVHEAVHYTKDGRGIPVEVHSHHVAYKGKEYAFVFARDISKRKEMEHSLRLAQYSLDHSGGMVFWLDARGQICDVNASACEQLGYQRDELIGRSMREVDPTLPEDTTQHWEKLREKKSLVFETVHRTKAGVVVPVEVTANYVDFEGREYSFQFARDITHRKRMEKKLRLTQYSVDHAEAQIFWVGPDGRLTYASEGACRQLGYARDEMLGLSIYQIDPGAPRPWEDHWRELREKGSLNFETKHQTKDGREMPVEVTAHFVEYEGKEYNFVFARDITQRKQMEESLWLTQVSMDRARDQIFWTDPEGRFVYANDAVCQQLGYSREELLGMSLHDIDITAPRPWSRAWQSLREAGSHVHEAIHRAKDGREIPVEVSANYVAYAGKEYNFVFARDITERKKAEAALRLAKDKAEAANRELEHSIRRTNQLALEAQAANEAKSAFLANMSHEIRTPMNGIIGMVDLLLDTDLTPEQRDYAETVQSSAEALLTVIGDILDFSKIEAKKIEFENLDFDLRLTLEDMMALLAIKAHEKGLELAVLVEPDVPSALRGDPGRLRQVLMNLVGNAIKFTEKGEVDVHVLLEREDEKEAVLKFIVKDTGIGIPEHIREQLFKPFMQADASTTRRYGGTGLGLSIAKGLVEGMGGEIGVESELGVGSTFWFRLPLSKGLPVASELDHIELANVAGVRVLGVDDSETNRRVLAGMLDSWGCRHTEVGSAKEALEALRQAVREGDPYQVAVLDMCMPEVDGEELALRIKSDPELAETGLVMMTSVGARGDAARMEKIGFAAYLVKPVRQSHFYDCLAAVVGRTKKQAESQRPETRERIITRHTLAERARRRARILLAEDNPVNQKVALKALEKLGYTADVANDGAEALQMSKENRYDLILMDVQMPGMDGMEATRHIRDPRSGSLNPAVVIVALTAHAMAGDRERCLDNGMDDYLAKPIKAAELQEVISRWLSAAPVGPESEPAPEVMAVAEEPAHPVFDEKVLLTLLEGDRESAAEIANEYLAGVRAQVAGIREAFDSKDAIVARERAHALKGSSASVGAEAMRFCAADLEKRAAQGDVDSKETLDLLAELEHQLSLLVALAEEKGGLL